MQEAAGKGPFARCWTATSFWGCLTCAAFRGCTCFRKFRKALCCRRGMCLRRASRPSLLPDGARRDLHEDSETESEGGDGDHLCQAGQVALGGPEGQGPLCLGPCRDSSSGPPIRLLQPDERTSCKEACEGDGYYFRACQRHRDMYEALRGRRACAVDGCNNAARSRQRDLTLPLARCERGKDDFGKENLSDHTPTFGYVAQRA